MKKIHISDIKMNLPCIPRSTQSKVVFCCFPTSYLAESGFNCVTYVLSKVRYRNVVKRDGLRLSLTTLQLDIQNLATSVYHVRNTLNTMPTINITCLLV